MSWPPTPGWLLETQWAGRRRQGAQHRKLAVPSQCFCSASVGSWGAMGHSCCSPEHFSQCKRTGLILRYLVVYTLSLSWVRMWGNLTLEHLWPPMLQGSPEDWPEMWLQQAHPCWVCSSALSNCLTPLQVPCKNVLPSLCSWGTDVCEYSDLLSICFKGRGEARFLKRYPSQYAKRHTESVPILARPPPTLFSSR